MVELKEKVDELLTRDRLRSDPRLKYFTAAVPSSKGRHSTADKDIDSWYKKQCIICANGSRFSGTVTRAHLVVGVSSPEYNYKEFNPPNYNTSLDPNCSKNFIPLCGTKGTHGCCHDAFDKFKLTIIHNVLLNTYTCYCFTTDDELMKYHGKTLTVHENHSPYKRLLAWHARYAISQNPEYVQKHGGIKNVDQLLDIIDASEDLGSIGETNAASSSGSTTA